MSKRWTITRKASVVREVVNKRISEIEACEKYELSGEELHLWLVQYTLHGAIGLKARPDPRHKVKLI